MRTLFDLPTRRRKYRSVTRPLPIDLTYEERHKSWPCKRMGYYVTAFTCLQCHCYEVHSDLVRKVTHVTGKCVFPRRASKESRRITNWNPYGDGVRKVTGFKKKRGGMSDKTDFAVNLMKEGVSRQEVIAALMEKFPKMSAGYAAAVQYQAMKKLKEEKE